MTLSKFEKGILKAFKNKEYEIIRTSKKEKLDYQKAARAALMKDKIITIRLNGFDLNNIKKLALNNGRKYQTYISDILHQHISRRLKVA